MDSHQISMVKCPGTLVGSINCMAHALELIALEVGHVAGQHNALVNEMLKY